ncbi:MerR family transcriptional regulator [Planobispora siamensis]|uniref:HTH-type transcriptional activator TipA n=1 Tax=Planobispora siamensis TaxID=936338 RepID=A0A8J3SP55_9ACTN|nr:MerR family transcriptional regulator [Planobispora siamensis]GIH96870.1 HTH-type transcriptional activator TipA [Planobispora siamensis]
MGYSVGQVARLAGVTVRTLHHYDEIGLLSPGQRTASGYRRYTDADLERLQHVLFYRELGFPLEEIAVILDEPSSDTLTHLRRQHELLSRRIGRLREMTAAIERAMEANAMGIPLTPEERFELFGDFRPEEHQAEAEERWGGTEAFEQSRRRMATMTKDDWKRFTAEAARTTEDFAKAFTDGLPADGEVAMDLAEEHRAHITRWCYDCSYEIHRGLGDMYVADPRFAANYEPLAPGLTQYIRDAIHANADRAGA